MIFRVKKLRTLCIVLCGVLIANHLVSSEIVPTKIQPIKDSKGTVKLPIRIVETTDNPPFSFVLPDGTKTGLYVEFWELWSKINGIPIEIIMKEFEEGVSIVKNKQAIHAGLFINEERKQWADFSLPIHQVETGILYSREYDKNTKLDQLKGITVSAYSNSFQAYYVRSNHPQVKFTPYIKDDVAFDQLIKGEIQAIVAELPFINAQLASRRLNGVLTVSDEVLLKNKVYAVMAKGRPELLEVINQGIENIPLNLLIDLEKKWLPTIEPFFKELSSVDFLTLNERSWLLEHSDFSLGVDTSWYPIDFSGKNGEFSGIASDYVAYVSKILNINMVPVKDSTWLESLNNTKVGKTDVMAAAVATENRKKSLHFTEPYFSVPIVIVTNKNAFYASNMESLFGKTLAVVDGFSMSDWVKEKYPKIKFIAVNSIVEGLEKVDTGEVDAYVGAISVINYEINKRDLRNIQISAFVPYKFEVSFAVRKGLEPLVPILNKVLARMPEKQKAIIANNWLAIHVKNGTNIYVVLLWGMPIIVVLTSIIFFITRLNKRLKKEVEIRKKAEKELQYMAYHDDLTGLANWRLFEELCNAKLNDSETSQMKQTFLFVDIDGFKEVNDSYGHKTGDLLLIGIAKRLQECLEEGHIVARIGGDEFIIYLCKEVKLGMSHDLVSHILDSLAKPFILAGNTVNISASIGVAMYPMDGDDTETLIKKADTAMYMAKQSGKNTYKYFTNIYY